MIYKVGDVLKAKEGCPMKTLAGQEVTIKYVGNLYYEIEEDGGMYAWTDKDFVDEPKNVIVEHGKTVGMSEHIDTGMPLGYNHYIEYMVDHCKKVLTSKHKEYATEDHFHNFNVAASLQGITPQQALIGMMDKHVVSVHDLVNDHAEGRKITSEMWQEKIGDNINYLLILWAMVNMGA